MPGELGLDHGPLRVGYLGGLGRSGTTLLARLLGTLPGVCDVGEVCHLWERGVDANERCGCGVPFHDCRFWSRVGRRAFGGWHAVDAETVRRLKAQVDRARHVPRLATRPPLSTHHVLTEYLRLHERLYAAIRDVAGCDTVLDASKHGSLAFCLRWSRRLDLRVVHCVRDSRAVAHSWRRAVPRPEATGHDALMPVYSPARSAVLWNMENGMLELLAARGTPVHRLRYEDLVRDPMHALRAVARFLGAPPPADDLIADGATRLPSSHSVSGNPMRFRQGELRIEPDEAWRAELTQGAARLVSALTLPLRVRYGYR